MSEEMKRLVKIEILKDLLKKEGKLKLNLKKVRIEIELLEKDLNGGSTLDGYITDEMKERG